MCEGAGLRNVVTYLQTGNLLFDADGSPEEVAQTIEGALIERGLRNAATVVRSLGELEAIVATDAFRDHPVEAFTRFVTLFRGDLPESAGDTASKANPGNILVTGREVYSVLPVDRPRGVDLRGDLEKKFKVQGTTRYFHIVEEVTRMLAEG